jgi:hypothetical protein
VVADFQVVGYRDIPSDDTVAIGAKRKDVQLTLQADLADLVGRDVRRIHDDASARDGSRRSQCQRGLTR